ncbi:MAG: phosphodiester glycosidase family protein [Anaerolineales bacterium]|nr:phosphodiester glycosidase family protein [Anaerolineales bacterium]
MGMSLLRLAAASASPVLATATPEPNVPPGFRLLDSAIGVQLYTKTYPGGSPDYMQVVDLGQGAALRPMLGPITERRSGKGVYGGDDPRMRSLPLQEYWAQARAGSKTAFCVTNGSFFYMLEYPTRLPFPVKVDGELVTEGWGIDTYVGEHLMLELWPGRADIRAQNKQTLHSSSAPDIIGGLTEHANKRADFAVGRTFIGVDDRDQDGAYEIVLALNTLSATQAQVAATLRSFGADEVMMLDGGGSTQLLCKSGHHIASERLIPQAIAILAGTPPQVSMQLARRPEWPILLEGQAFPFALEIENTGSLSWPAGETQLVLEKSALGGQLELGFASEVEPGETLAISHTLAAYTSAGVYPVQFNWGILHEGKLYPGEPLELLAVVLPPDLAERRGELSEQIRQWRREQPDQAGELAANWIQQHSRRGLQVLSPGELAQINLADVVWVPLLMLPVIVVLALVIARIKR